MDNYAKKESKYWTILLKRLIRWMIVPENMNLRYGTKKNALHEIKYILHKVGKYDKHDNNEIQKIDKYFDFLL